MLGSIGPMEIGILLVIVLILFGPKRLPQLGRSVGEALRELRNVGKQINDEEEDE